MNEWRISFLLPKDVCKAAMSTIAIIDYGMGNLHSAAKAVARAVDKAKVIITSEWFFPVWVRCETVCQVCKRLN